MSQNLNEQGYYTHILSPNSSYPQETGSNPSTPSSQHLQSSSAFQQYPGFVLDLKHPKNGQIGADDPSPRNSFCGRFWMTSTLVRPKHGYVLAEKMRPLHRGCKITFAASTAEGGGKFQTRALLAYFRGANYKPWKTFRPYEAKESSKEMPMYRVQRNGVFHDDVIRCGT
ncbi:hypothetical protein Tco_0934031 [Tanacetum coccineum]